MAEIRRGVRSILARPQLYELLQWVMGATRVRQAFVGRDVRPKPGDRILDVGCGPAELLNHLPAVTYVGFDVNPDYIAQARSRYGDRGSFFAKPFEDEDADRCGPFDIAIISAVLHHLDEDEAKGLFQRLRRCVRPGGRVVTLDNVFVPDQNPIARKLIEWDRGQNVRSPEGYAALARPFFSHVEGRVDHRRMIPYTYWIMECS